MTAMLDTFHVPRSRIPNLDDKNLTNFTFIPTLGPALPISRAKFFLYSPSNAVIQWLKNRWGDYYIKDFIIMYFVIHLKQ